MRLVASISMTGAINTRLPVFSRSVPSKVGTRSTPPLMMLTRVYRCVPPSVIVVPFTSKTWAWAEEAKMRAAKAAQEAVESGRCML